MNALDFDGARTIWNRIFDITKDEYNRLYDEAYEKRDGYWDTWLRARNTAEALGFGDGPAGALLYLGGGGLGAAASAALARLLRPTIGQDGGITQEDYDLLAGPWAAVIAPVHEDDGKDHSVWRDAAEYLRSRYPVPSPEQTPGDYIASVAIHAAVDAIEKAGIS